MASFRMQKVDSEIRNILSEIIAKKLCEELSFPTINFVSTAKDLSRSKIYIGFTPNNQHAKFRKLLSNKRLIQKEFACKIHLKKTPKLEFILDTQQAQINKVEKILDHIGKK